MNAELLYCQFYGSHDAASQRQAKWALSAGCKSKTQRRLHVVVPSLRNDATATTASIWEVRATSPRRLEPQHGPRYAPERRVGGPSRLGGLRRRLTVLGRRPGREIMSSAYVAASQKPPEFYRASSPESRIPEPALAPARLRLLSGREEPAARRRPRETPIADESARPPRDQKAEKPTPQRTGKPSRAGGATFRVAQ